MYKNKKIMAVIPARGGSKGIYKKNIAMLYGKPLLAWSITAVKNSKYVDKIILSSDDSEIIAIAQKYGCEVPFVRPDEFSRDDTPGIVPLIHAIKQVPGFDFIILLQPTSPLRNSEDIDKSIELCIDLNKDTCVSVMEDSHSPYWSYTINSDKIIKPLFEKESQSARRQDLPKTYSLNGAVYVANTKFVLKYETLINEETLAYIMPAERSVDIDNKMDLIIAESILKNQANVHGEK